MSHHLSNRSIEHVVLERREVANSWRTERWDSLRLLTPNWQSRLPGFEYDGDDPDGFMTGSEVADFIVEYAAAISAPVRTNTTVTSVRALASGYEVSTDEGDWECAAVVVASGACNLASVPAAAGDVPAFVHSLTPMDYHNPDQLPAGGVLMVGASATGIQLADEIHRSGRPVTISVGEHVRLPRLYRGRDIYWWMDAAGVLDETYVDVDDIVRARSVPSPQLIGTSQRASLDLNALTDIGVKLVGRLGRISDGKVQFSGSLLNNCALADLKMARLLGLLDEWATENGLDGEVEPPHRFEATRVDPSPALGLDFEADDIATVIWATGFRPDYSWLHVPVCDRKGRIRHDGGVVDDAPGMYLMGTNFLRRRRSSFINGAGADADELSDHLAAFLDDQSSSATPP